MMKALKHREVKTRSGSSVVNDHEFLIPEKNARAEFKWSRN